MKTHHVANLGYMVHALVSVHVLSSWSHDFKMTVQLLHHLSEGIYGAHGEYVLSGSHDFKVT